METAQARPDVSDSLTDSGSVNGSGESITQSNSSAGEKIRSHNLRLVLKPLPIEDNEENLESETSIDSALDDARSSVSRLPFQTVLSISVCMQRFYLTVLESWCDRFCIVGISSSQHLTAESSKTCAVTESSACDRKSQSEGGMGVTVGKGRKKHCQRAKNNHPNSRSRPRLKLRQIEDDEQDVNHLRTDSNVKETSIFDYIEQMEPDKIKNPPSSSGQNVYPLAYHSLAFLPYNPLPEQLEKVIFPSRTNPLAAFDDPYWPAKGPCLALVQEVRANPHIASFPGTFLPPAARGAE